MIDFGGYWDKFVSLEEFMYNKSYFLRTNMDLFEELYERGCRSLVNWSNAFEVRPWSSNLLRESLEKIKFIQVKLRACQSRQKEYVGHKVRDIEFMIGEQVLLKVSPSMGMMRFGKRVKIHPRYIRPFEILDLMGKVAHNWIYLQV